MDFAEPDYDPIRHEALGVTPERWKELIKILMDEGYITGVEMRSYLREEKDQIIRFGPHITLKGLEYLHENSMMQKALKLAKGVVDKIPIP